MATRLRFYKDPLDTIAYSLDWTGEIRDPKTIITSSWIGGTGINIVASSNDDFNSTVLLSGGSVGDVYKLVNYITDSAGFVSARSVDVVVQNRLEYVEKLAGEKLQYSLDWSDIDVTVASNVWLPISGLTLTNPQYSDQLATITVNGGIVGNVYPVRHQLTTVGGQILHKGFALRII